MMVKVMSVEVADVECGDGQKGGAEDEARTHMRSQVLRMAMSREQNADEQGAEIASGEADKAAAAARGDLAALVCM